MVGLVTFPASVMASEAKQSNLDILPVWIASLRSQ